MARDWHGSGAARQAGVGEVEFGGTQNLANFAFETDPMHVRGGGTALRFTGQGYIESVTGFARHQEYLRCYVKLGGTPTAVGRIHLAGFFNAADEQLACLVLNDLKLEVVSNLTTFVQVAPFVFPIGGWSFIELYLDMNGKLEAKQDNTLFCSTVSHITVAGPIDRMRIGPYNQAPGTTIWFTDYAMNSTTGRFCTSWCGESEGGIRLLTPTADQAPRATFGSWVAQNGGAFYAELDDLPGALDTTTYVKETAGIYGAETSISMTSLGAEGIVAAMLWGMRGGGTGTSNRLARIQAQRYTDPQVLAFSSDQISPVAYRDGPNINWNLNGWKTVYPCLTLESRLSQLIYEPGMDYYWALTGGQVDVMAARILRADENNPTEIRITAIWAYVDLQRVAIPLSSGGTHPRMLIELGDAPPPAPLPPQAQGGFLELATDLVIRPVVYPTLPNRGPFTFPAPYNTEASRITAAADCGGGDYVNHIGYSYWRRINNHVGRPTLYVMAVIDRNRGGAAMAGPTLYEYHKTTRVVTNLGPLFDSASSWSYHHGEGWYFSATQPDILYICNDTTLYRYHVITKTLSQVVTIGQFGIPGAAHARQFHSSHDDNVHSMTVQDASYVTMGALIYRESDTFAGYYAQSGPFDECQVDASGGWLLIKQQITGTPGDHNTIVNLATGIQNTWLDANGNAGHSDSGYGYCVAEDNYYNAPGAVRRFRFDEAVTAAPLVYRMTDWAVSSVGHISHTNASTSGTQWVACSNAHRTNQPRVNEICAFRLDTSLQVLVIAPVMTNLNAAGGGPNDYEKLPKGNLDITGEYFVWTSNVGSNRLDAFIVRVPKHLLVGS